MPLVIFILARLLLIGCLVFIFGYIFGNFSRSARLTRITKVASVLLLLSFIGINALFFAAKGWRYGNFNRNPRFEAHCSRAVATTLR